MTKRGVTWNLNACDERRRNILSGLLTFEMERRRRGRYLAWGVSPRIRGIK